MWGLLASKATHTGTKRLTATDTHIACHGLQEENKERKEGFHQPGASSAYPLILARLGERPPPYSCMRVA